MFIDANLLVLLVVGSVDEGLVGKHRRTQIFTRGHYGSLRRVVEATDRVSVTPNTLTEASNLLEDPKDTRFLHHLRRLIDLSEEVVVDSKVAARHRKYPTIGLTDSALLEVVSQHRPLLTIDHDLYGQASAKGEGVAYNFWHHQTW